MDDQPLLNDDTEASIDGFARSADPEHLAARETLEVLVTHFTDEARRGLSPSIEDYADRHPALADEIRELFPLLATLEEWSVHKEVESTTESFPVDFRLRSLGDYRLLREAGRGGMGVVFEAVQAETSRRVAVKVLPLRQVADLSRRKDQLRREAATLAQLRHRNIVPVYSFGEHEGYCYYVMQFVDGVNLGWLIQRLRDNADAVKLAEISQAAAGDIRVYTPPADPSQKLLARDSWNGFATIGIQVAMALAHAHQRGVLHNDIKPGNLLLNTEGRVVVTDFGVGIQPDPTRPEQPQHALGTLRYMAPERLYGHSDARSDVYSLGATLYELISQTPLYAAPDRRELMRLVKQAAPRPLTELVPGLPRDLATIIHRTLAGDPNDRPATAQAFISDLLRFVQGDPLEAPSTSLMGRLFGRRAPR
jgi:serine/threonine protein kinase